MGDEYCAKVANNIKKFRDMKRLTLKELGNKVNISEGTMQKYEAGNIKRIDIDMLCKIADALDVSPGILAGWEKEKLRETPKPKQGIDEAQIIKLYTQLNLGHQKAIRLLMKNLIECQEKYNSDK